MTNVKLNLEIKRIQGLDQFSSQIGAQHSSSMIRIDGYLVQIPLFKIVCV